MLQLDLQTKEKQMAEKNAPRRKAEYAAQEARVGDQ
jgi:hypothetical protein